VNPPRKQAGTPSAQAQAVAAETAVTAQTAAGITLTQVVPDSLAAGSPPTSVDVYGSGFTATCKVQSDTVIRDTFYLDAGHLQFTARPDTVTAASVRQVTVEDTDGTISNSLPLTVTGPPAVATISFWACDCGLSISASRPVPQAPICICGRTMYPIPDRAPKVLYDVVWVDPQNQRNR
jgi:hypothetical protein